MGNHIGHFLSPGLRIVAGKFKPNGSSAPNTAYIHGEGISSITRMATGRWRVTLDEPVHGFVAIVVNLSWPTGGTNHYDIRSASLSPSNGRFDIEYRASTDTTATHPQLSDLNEGTPPNDRFINFIAICSVVAQSGDGVP